jgi:di/tripeptidase
MMKLVRMVVVTAAVLGLGVADSSQSNTPDTGNSTWGNTVGASPKNGTVAASFRYQFNGTLRDLNGVPVAGFPAAQMELDFTDCMNPNTRPSNQIPADGPSDVNGNVTWSLNLNFGGGDPCGPRVLIQNIVFKQLAPHQGLPNNSLDGGVRSPDENGDGVISLVDLGIFQTEFVNTGARFDYRGDISQEANGGPFDGITSLPDLACYQVHFTAP